jgi:two-component system sensor histidine kinase KdpD
LVVGYGAALLAVTVVSLFIGLVLGEVNLANVSMLYLLAVMASAVGFGRGPAIFASLLAFLILDWFFVEPAHQLTVSDPGEWVSLLFFLLTATVTGQLAAGQRQRAHQAQQREREAVVLYDVVRLLSEGDPDQVLEAVAKRLRRELQVKAVAIEMWQANGTTTWVSAGDHERWVRIGRPTRWQALVGNLLDLSRIEGGSLKPQMSWQELDLLIGDTVDRLKPVTRHHRLRVEVLRDLPPMWFDPVEIGEVLYNLIENATKYAPPETEIDVSVTRNAREVSVAVEDRGPGIPATALPYLFDPFYRVIDGKPRPQGLGLGLAIVKGLVEAHGGRVWAENRAGGGAQFTFTLPVSAAPAAIAPAGKTAS